MVKVMAGDFADLQQAEEPEDGKPSGNEGAQQALADFRARNERSRSSSREPGRKHVPADCIAEEKIVSVWRYSPCNGIAASARKKPDFASELSGFHFYVGDLLEVTEERLSGRGVIFLRLTDNRGWMFNCKLGVGTMCVRLKLGALTPEEKAACAANAEAEKQAALSIIDVCEVPGEVVAGTSDREGEASADEFESASEGTGGEEVRQPAPRTSTSSQQSRDRKSTASIKSLATFLSSSGDPTEGLTDDPDDAPVSVLEQIIASAQFEAAFALLILVNTIVLAVEVQYWGIDAGFKISYPGSPKSADEAWPGAYEVFKVADICFGIIFSLELGAKVVALKKKIFKDVWNFLDAIIVGVWILSVAGSHFFPLNPMLLRLGRLARLGRVMRLAKTVKILAVDALYLMTTSIKASMSALTWSIAVIAVVQMMFAMVLNQTLEPWMQDDANALEKRHVVYMYYGTFSRGMLTMFEITIGNWIPPCRALTENVNEWYLFIMLTHQVCIGFAVVKVIMGVFLQVTFTVAATDDTIMMNQKERSINQHVRKMHRLFKVADSSGDGLVDEYEWMSVLDNPITKKWLSAMELDVRDAKLIFDLVDTGDGEISAEDLVVGMARLKGAARSVDFLQLMRDHRRMQAVTEEIATSMGMSTGEDSGSKKKMTMKQTLRISSGSENEDEKEDTAGSPATSPRATNFAVSKGSTNSAGSTKTRSHCTFVDGDVRPSFAGVIQANSHDCFALFEAIVSTWQFEMFFAMLIVSSTLVMAFEVQWKGIGTGHLMQYPGSTNNKEDAWPGAGEVFVSLEWIFGVLFAMEIMAKIAVQRLRFCKEAWNWFDFFVVICWVFDKLGSRILPVSPMLLRLARLARLARILRLVRAMRGFDSLYLMTTAIQGSLPALMWSTLLLGFALGMTALVLNAFLMEFIQDESKPLEQRTQVYKYYGTFSRAMLTVFEITLANWIPSNRVLVEYVSEWYILFALAHKCFMGFAVVMVLSGIFMQETFKVAANDDTIMMNQRERAIKTHTEKMTRLFQYADESGDGLLDREEFKNVVSNPFVKTWLGAMDLDLEDAEVAFDLVDPGTGQLTADELVRGVARLKGVARSIDLNILMRESQKLNKLLERVATEQLLRSAGSQPQAEPSNSEIADQPEGSGGSDAEGVLLDQEAAEQPLREAASELNAAPWTSEVPDAESVCAEGALDCAADDSVHSIVAEEEMLE